ncbi:MAG: cytochrome c oxidase subunit 3, partial [Pseudohongiellaceae bacterium]
MNFYKDVTDKSWERKGLLEDLASEPAFAAPPQKVALVFFLGVATVIFSLFTVSYFIRMELPDWTPLAEPGLLWINTALLVLSSVLFQWSRSAIRNRQEKLVKLTVIGGGLFALAFIAGQLAAWRELSESGMFLAGNPANSFFYLLTGIHAIHLLGGLWVWSKSSLRLLSGGTSEEIRLSVELSTLYWHFLLLLWV